MNRPIIGITMGDAAGVGPEIIMKSLNDADVYTSCRPFVIGDFKILKRAGRIVQTALQIRSIQSVAEAQFQHGTVDCLDLNLLSEDLPIGQISAEAGHASFCFLKKAIELAKAGEIDAICTAPLNKEALHKGGHLYPNVVRLRILASMMLKIND